MNSAVTSEGKFRTFNVDPMAVDLIGDRYWIEKIEVDSTTASGIELPGYSEETAGWQVGRVIKVGNGHRLEKNEQIPMFFKVGDLVICERYSGRELLIRGKKYMVMNQTSVFGKVG